MNDKTVLIVEDEAALLKALTERFEAEGFKVLTSKNGEEGFKTAIEQKPDLLILDLLMPRINGMQMLKRLREAGEYGKKVSVIILTNLDASDDILQDVIKTEPTFYFIKSNMDISEVITKAKEALA